jgi:hypothetical protein
MENLTVVISLLVGLGGLGVNALKEYLAYRERVNKRTELYREALYQKQVQIVDEVFESFHVTSTAASALFAALHKEDDEATSHFSTRLEEKHRKTFDLIGRSAPLLPNAVMNASTHYLKLFAVLIEVAESKREMSLEELRKKIHSAEFQLIVKSREMLGVDALSRESKKLFAGRNSFDYDEVLNHYAEGYDSEFDVGT